MGRRRMTARLVARVGNADEFDAGNARVFGGVMTAERAVADDTRAKRSSRLGLQKAQYKIP